MRRATAVILAAILVVQAWGTVYAMEGKGCKQCRENAKAGCWQVKRADRMAKKLDLTPDQKAKVSVIVKESGEKTKAEMQKSRESVRAIHAEADRQIKEVLTPEQTQKFENMRADQKSKMAKKMQKMHCHQKDTK